MLAWSLGRPWMADTKPERSGDGILDKSARVERLRASNLSSGALGKSHMQTRGIWATETTPESHKSEDASLLIRIIPKIRRQPSFNLANRHSLTLSIVFNLIALDLCNGKIFALWMTEIPARNRCPRPHRIGLR